MMKGWTKQGVAGVVGISLAALASGCASPGYQQHSSAVNQGAVGAGVGTAVGMMAGNNIPGLSREEGAVAGALLGALIGGTMGHQADTSRAQYNSLNEQVNTTVVNVTNSNGSITPVTLRRVGPNWVGPRGEYYNSLPTAEQLKCYGF